MRAFDSDEWSRLRHKLGERRQALLEEIAQGGYEMAQYHNSCGRVAMLDEAIEIILSIRRGDDLRPPPSRLPTPHPED